MVSAPEMLETTDFQVYVFAVLFTQTVGAAKQELDAHAPELRYIEQYFGSLSDTMLLVGGFRHAFVFSLLQNEVII